MYWLKCLTIFTVFLIAVMGMIHISLFGLTISFSIPPLRGADESLYDDYAKFCSHLYWFESVSQSFPNGSRPTTSLTTREDRIEEFSVHAEAKFQFLTSIMRKIHSGWLQGRTTDNKAYFDEQYISLSHQLYSEMKESENDRRSQLQHLSTVVRKKITDIQNPPNCSEAKLLVYDITWYQCGFGCNLHNIIMYFMQSIYANRTFVLLSAGWNYDRRGWEHHLLPFGNCKYESNARELPLLSDKTKHERIVTTTIDDYGDFDWFIPDKVLSKLRNIHPDPYTWWVGQFVAYAFRLQSHIIDHIQRIGDDIGFTDNVVGIHVRWGDKLFYNEAIKHEVDKYMDFVEAWFRIHEIDGENLQRVVFVATEISDVWVDLKSRYPEYHFIGSGYVNETKDLEPEKKNYYQERENALESILIDLHFLSKCDYVVCTLSSEVCATTYELMMSEKADSYFRLQSLDLFYIFHDVPRYKAIQRHVPVSGKEMSMEIGDTIIGVDNALTKNIDGYYIAMNNMTGCEGEVPIYKLESIVNPIWAAVFDDL